MSVFQTEQIGCPACGEPVDFNVVYSINADRRPGLRDAILDGTLQRESCPKCEREFRLEPEVTYIDLKRNQWLIVRPVDKLGEWTELEEACRTTFAQAYGPTAPAPVQAIGRAMQVRVTFGWAALREKLVCRERGLDDTTLELLKLALFRNADELPLADTAELRLDDVDGDELVFVWIEAATLDPIEVLRVPRALYDEIHADTTGWKALRDQLAAGPFIDIHRLLVEAA